MQNCHFLQKYFVKCVNFPFKIFLIYGTINGLKPKLLFINDKYQYSLKDLAKEEVKAKIYIEESEYFDKKKCSSLLYHVNSHSHSKNEASKYSKEAIAY